MSISQTLNLLSQSKEWDQQLEYLGCLPITEEMARKLNNSKNASIIMDLLGNPKSKVITSACSFLSDICEKYGALMHPFVAFFIGNEVGYRLLGSANKVVAQEANQLFKSVVLSAPHQKMFAAFAREMSSKSTHVRECISSYILVLSDCLGLPQNYMQSFVQWKADASKQVRQNMRKLEEIMNKKQVKNKQNINPSIPKTGKQTIQNSQLIMDSFLSSQQQRAPNTEEMSENIDFLLSKISSNETWSMKQYAITQLCELYQHYHIPESQAVKLVNVFLGLLDQKRSKINNIMCLMLSKAVLAHQEAVKALADDKFGEIVDKALRIDDLGPKLVMDVVNLDAQKYIMLLAQTTVNLKSIREKALALDLLVELVTEQEIPVMKVPIIVKLLSRHIEKLHTHKEIYLPCLAILSHMKVKYPSQLLGCLLCLDKNILSRVIELAESVDPNLREAVVSYIHSMKSNPDKERKQDNNSNSHGSENLAFKNSKLQPFLRMIEEETEDSVAGLVEYVFHSKDTVTTREFFEIIKLTEKVTTKNTLLELELLLDEICKTHNQNFLDALFQAISSCDGNTIESEYIVAYLRKVQTLFHNWSWMMTQKYAQKLINIYRFSKCPKTRLMTIKILSLFPSELTSSHLNLKQRKLIESQHKVDQDLQAERQR